MQEEEQCNTSTMERKWRGWYPWPHTGKLWSVRWLIVSLHTIVSSWGGRFASHESTPTFRVRAGLGRRTRNSAIRPRLSWDLDPIEHMIRDKEGELDARYSLWSWFSRRWWWCLSWKTDMSWCKEDVRKWQKDHDRRLDMKGVDDNLLYIFEDESCHCR